MLLLTPPEVQAFGYGGGDPSAGFVSVYAARQQSVVRGARVTHVGVNRQSDSILLKLFGRRRPADPPGVFSAGMFGDGPPLVGGASRKEFSHAARERAHVLGIEFLAPFGGALPGKLPGLRIGQAFLLRPGKRFLLDEQTLPLIAFPRAAEAHHDRLERRVAACSPGERGIATREEEQVIEIRARETERMPALQMQKTSFAELLAALRAGGVSPDPEDDDLARPRGLTILSPDAGARGLDNHCLEPDTSH